MSKLFPDIAVDSVLSITDEILDENGIKGLIIDIDNTLTLHGSQEISEIVLKWLEGKRGKYNCILLSNNHKYRVEPFGKMLGMEYIYDGAKPLYTKGLSRAVSQLGITPKETAVIGDQIFTDVLGGNRLGALTIRVKPIQTEGGWFFRLKRWLEDKVMGKYRESRGKQ